MKSDICLGSILGPTGGTRSMAALHGCRDQGTLGERLGSVARPLIGVCVSGGAVQVVDSVF
jgi:hypothetical protein